MDDQRNEQALEQLIEAQARGEAPSAQWPAELETPQDAELDIRTSKSGESGPGEGGLWDLHPG